MARVTKSTSYRLGRGMYQDPDGHAARTDARNTYFQAVKRIKPIVFEQLADAPFAAFCDATEVYDPLDLDTWDGLRIWQEELTSLGARGWETLPIEEAELAAVSALIAALETWGERWRLTNDWCYNQALAILVNWQRTPKWRDKLMLAGQPWGETVLMRAEDRRFHFEHPGWDPNSDTREEAEANVTAAFERELAGYLDRVDACKEERVKAAGLVPTPEKRRRYWPPPELTPEALFEAWYRHDHFAWLVRYQYLGESHPTIARDANKDRSTIAEGVEKTAALVGVEPRERRRRRPRSQRTHSRTVEYRRTVGG